MVTCDDPVLDISYVTKYGSKVIRCNLMIFSQIADFKKPYLSALCSNYMAFHPVLILFSWVVYFTYSMPFLKMPMAFCYKTCKKGFFPRVCTQVCSVRNEFHLFGAPTWTVIAPLVINDIPPGDNSKILHEQHIFSSWQSVSITNPIKYIQRTWRTQVFVLKEIVVTY